MSYISVVGETVTERTVEKSRFLTYTAHTEGEEEAKAFLARVRALHPLATHICYGFVADAAGNLQRFSDDGEPQGTAGMPILNVVKSKKLVQTTVAVVRYFGGIKLGAGGLTRAYACSAAEGCERAETRQYDLCAEILVRTAYPEVNALMRFLENYEVLAREFTEQACFTVAVKADRKEEFAASLTDYLNGNVEISVRKQYFYAFSLVKNES